MIWNMQKNTGCVFKKNILLYITLTWTNLYIQKYFSDIDPYELVRFTYEQNS